MLFRVCCYDYLGLAICSNFSVKLLVFACWSWPSMDGAFLLREETWIAGRALALLVERDSDGVCEPVTGLVSAKSVIFCDFCVRGVAWYRASSP